MAEVYEGLVSVYDKKADGTLLTIGKGDRKGEPYYKISFKVNGEYVNLMDFQGVTGGQQGMFRVEYYQKFDPKTGQPELYNDKPQYNLESIMPLGAPATPQNGAFSNPATPGSPAPQMGADRNESIREQTSLKAAAEMYAAVLAANKALKWEHDEFERIFTGTKATLDGKNEFDSMMDAAKEKMEVVEEQVEMPGPVAPENPEDHEFDGTF